MMLLMQSLLIAWAVKLVLPRWSLPLALAIGLLALIPLHEGVSLAMALRGLWGDPSVTTVLLVLLSLCNRSPAVLVQDWRLPAAIAAIATVFYIMALGWGDFDPYRLGYQPWGLIAVLALPALYAWWRGHALPMWILAADVLTFATGLPESTNLWDTLLDPLLAMACLVLAIRNGLRIYKKKTT